MSLYLFGDEYYGEQYVVADGLEQAVDTWRESLGRSQDDCDPDSVTVISRGDIYISNEYIAAYYCMEDIAKAAKKLHEENQEALAADGFAGLDDSCGWLWEESTGVDQVEYRLTPSEGTLKNRSSVEDEEEICSCCGGAFV